MRRSLRNLLLTHPPPPPFSPADLPGLVGWYDDLSDITLNGDDVSQWDDRSVEGNHIPQSTPTKQPLKVDNIKGSFRGISFDGASEFLQVIYTQSQPVTLYAVLRLNSWTNGKVPFDGGGDTTMQIIEKPPSANVKQISNSSFKNPIDIGVSIWNICTWVFDSANSLAQLNNGAEVASGSPGTLAPTGITIGASFNGFQHANMSIIAGLLYSANHDAENRTKVNTYLGNRYSITLA